MPTGKSMYRYGANWSHTIMLLFFSLLERRTGPQSSLSNSEGYGYRIWTEIRLRSSSGMNDSPNLGIESL